MSYRKRISAIGLITTIACAGASLAAETTDAAFASPTFAADGMHQG